MTDTCVEFTMKEWETLRPQPGSGLENRTLDNYFGMFDTRWAPIALYMGTDIISIIILGFLKASEHIATRTSIKAAKAGIFTG